MHSQNKANVSILHTYSNYFESKNDKISSFMKHIHCVRTLFRPLSIDMKKQKGNFKVRSMDTVFAVLICP